MVVPMKFIVGVRHALTTPQSYDVSVYVYTYSKVDHVRVTTLDCVHT